MTEAKILRWLGMICLVAGIARMGMTPTSLAWGTDSPQELTFGYIACVLMSAGSFALYLAQARETGVLGFLSALGIVIGNVLTTALVFTTFIVDTAENPPEGLAVAITGMGNMIGMMGGTLLLTILTFRAKVFPVWVPILFVVMMASMFLPIADNKYFAFFWGLAYVGAGWCIWTGRLKPREQSLYTAEAAGAQARA
ncbi:hypothetical protein [Cohnella sp. GbtcB17]|uniref:hypothetical protein n=1 Tax=Cohnella sp. GbtcB17 TaxID=2824762 RepID=UPI001C303FD9|nr:hypothetical protein [Cohnella sp. GbtcB17]